MTQAQRDELKEFLSTATWAALWRELEQDCMTEWFNGSPEYQGQMYVVAKGLHHVKARCTIAAQAKRQIDGR